MLRNLVYYSLRSPSCGDRQIQEILEWSELRNAERGITGVLLYNETHFLQVLEGEWSQLKRLYGQIRLDNRHHNSQLISTAPLDRRQFPSWKMGVQNLEGQGYIFQGSTSPRDQRIFQQIMRDTDAAGDQVMALVNTFFDQAAVEAS